MTRSHAIPGSTISVLITPGLTSSPQAFRASGALTAAIEMILPEDATI